MSDLHIEFFDFRPAEVAANVVVLAGGILNEHHGLAWARRAFPRTPVLYVMGNHEFYGAHYERVSDLAQNEALRVGVHLLGKDQVVIDGVRFIGATLWTNFEVEAPEHDVNYAMWYANRSMSDFELIRYRGRMLRANDIRVMHGETCAWWVDRLSEPFGRRPSWVWTVGPK